MDKDPAALTRGNIISHSSPELHRWHHLVDTRGCAFHLTDSWQTDADPSALAHLGPHLFEWRIGDERRTIAFEVGEVLLYAAFNGNGIVAKVAAPIAHRIAALALLDDVRRLAPEARPDDRDIPIIFWTLNTQHRPTRSMRKLEGPCWDDISSNYTASTRDALERIVRLDDAPSRGQLLLWHGPPGTGKTWALHALARAWTPWCDIEYVTDPDALLECAGYLRDVVLDDRTDRWRLIVLEDTGEILAADANVRTGQKLSRLLNTVDGFIGRGRRLLVLVTTNEDIRTLHPAVTRPGRCASLIEFRALSTDEARAWLAHHGPADGVDRQTTLAELYTGEVTRERGPIGFRP